jgi:hypothetical protein
MVDDANENVTGSLTVSQKGNPDLVLQGTNVDQFEIKHRRWAWIIVLR